MPVTVIESSPLEITALPSPSSVIVKSSAVNTVSLSGSKYLIVNFEPASIVTVSWPSPVLNITTFSPALPLITSSPLPPAMISSPKPPFKLSAASVPVISNEPNTATVPFVASKSLNPETVNDFSDKSTGSSINSLISGRPPSSTFCTRIVYVPSVTVNP